ncbi:MAG: GSCFA domain-containing protein [Bacteroidota bacterium]
MKLQTNLPLKPNESNQINYDSKLLLLGSCFSENIGDKFSYYKFQSLINPFGILFHPLAIEKFISSVISQKLFSSNDTFYNNDRYHSFESHSRLSHISQDQLVQNLNDKREQTFQFLNETTHIVITLGTAWAYKHIQSNQYVANCHKVPQNQFTKHLLSVEEITQSLTVIKNQILEFNPKVKFILTISPVRHLKDGFLESTRSKAHLIAAVHKVLNLEAFSKTVHADYFPSYEIVMDELRDYRFFKEDMIHPNQIAVDYIWEQFQKVHISKEVDQVMIQVADIQNGLNHRPLNPNSKAHQSFLQKLNEKQLQLTSKYPHIQF